MTVTERLLALRVRPWVAGLLAVAVVGMVSSIDPQFHVSARFTLFYLLPVAAAAWAGGRRVGLAVAAAAAVAQLIADFRISPGHQMSALWNFGTDLLVYVALTLLLSTLRTKLSEEHENARTDPLTGLGNVRAFRAAAEAEVARCRRYHRPLSLALVDLDDFKQVNDTHGHGAGDDVLRATAQHLAESVRSTDTVARVGGDEFVILLPETDPAQAAAAVGHLRSRPVAADLPVGFSVGVVTYADDPPSVEDILAEADRAMYAEKRAGRLPD